MANSKTTANNEPSAISGLDDDPQEGPSLTSLTESGVDTLTVQNLRTLDSILPEQGMLATMYGQGGPHSVASKLYEQDTSRPQSPGSQYPRQASNRQPRSGSSLVRRRISFVIVAAVMIMFFFGLRLLKADSVGISTLCLRTPANLHSASTSGLSHEADPV